MSRTTGPAHTTSKTTSRSSRLTLAAAGALLALGLSGCDARAVLDGPTGPNSAASQSPASAGTALAALEQIPLKGRAPKTGYSREEFGSAWADVDRDGCDTRNQVLNRDLSDVVHATSVPCKVESGVLDDPYTGTRIEFQRGQDTSSDVQIDHIIALSNAWQTGAQQLTAEERLQLANDPLNLRSADGPTNGVKGDGDAATWLPPNKAFRCEYVATQTAVKAKYELWMTAPNTTPSCASSTPAPTSHCRPEAAPRDSRWPSTKRPHLRRLRSPAQRLLQLRPARSPTPTAPR